MSNVTVSRMSGQEMVDLCKRHTIYEWSAQSAVDPIPVARAEGIYFWTPEGKRYIDFNSQLMCVNIGHGDERSLRAIQEQAATLAYANPFMATEVRARLGVKLAEITPGDIDAFFFTNGGAEANENAIRIARTVTGPPQDLARYRSYHGGTAGAITLTGDPRRWAAEPGIPGVVRVPDFLPRRCTRARTRPTKCSRALEDVIQLRRAAHDRGNHHRAGRRHQRPADPARRLHAGPPRALRQHGILLIADEVMAGFGRTGGWFAVDHWDVVPDLITMAKGLTSAYVQLGAVGMRPDRRALRGRAFSGGLTYNSHPLGVRGGTGDDRRV